MFTKLRFPARILLVCALPVLLTACVLRSLFGNVIIVSDIGEEVNEIIATVFSDSTAAVCLDTDYGFYECTYIIDGEIITSTLYLLGDYGITGVLIDPVILQAPQEAGEIMATYDLGDGPEPLSVAVRQSFNVTPDVIVSAETNQQFFILELPASVANTLPPGSPQNGTPITYTLSFKQVQPIADPIDPVSVKVLLAGKVTINGHHYYVPILPCVTDFAGIPAIEIPQSNTPVNLESTVGNLIRQGEDFLCDHDAYYFANVPPPPQQVFLPSIIR